MPWPNWSFAGFEFPIEDSPVRGKSGEWNWEEKLVEHDPLNANVTILTSWGRRSARRTISGVCGEGIRDKMRSLQQDGTTGALIDSEDRSVQARIVRTDFNTLIPGLRYEYSLEFIQR